MPRPTVVHKVRCFYVSSTGRSGHQGRTYDCYSKTEARSKIRELVKRCKNHNLRRKIVAFTVPFGWTRSKAFKARPGTKFAVAPVRWYDRVMNLETGCNPSEERR
jgi:hypothetical protein